MAQDKHSSLAQREETLEALRRYVLQEAWDSTDFSNCLDKRLGSILVKNGQIIGRGSNLCAPPSYDYGDRLLFCPRWKSKRGTARNKCRGFHAEVFACLSATKKGIIPKDYARFSWGEFGKNPAPFGEEPRTRKEAETKRILQKRFSERDREGLRGAELYLVGVAYVCDACQWLLDWLEIVVHENNIIPGRISPDEIARRIESESKK